MVRITTPARVHKAARLVHTRSIRPIRARVFEVQGDTGVCVVTVSTAMTSCTCTFGRLDTSPRNCSHVIGVKAYIAQEKVKRAGDVYEGFPKP